MPAFKVLVIEQYGENKGNPKPDAGTLQTQFATYEEAQATAEELNRAYSGRLTWEVRESHHAEL